MSRDDELLTVEEVASLLRVPRSWVYEHSRPQSAEPLPHVKLGKYLRFYKKDVLHYLDKRREAETTRGA